MKWLDLDMQIYATHASTAPAVRIYVVVESTALGSLSTAAQFFVDNTNFAVTSQRDRTNRDASRWLVLYDSKIIRLGTTPYSSGLSNVAWTGQNPLEYDISIHLKLDGITTDYSRGNAGTVSDIDTNAIHLIVVTDDTNAANVNVIGGFTLCFNDDS
jgi:hypothetical protein